MKTEVRGKLLSKLPFDIISDYVVSKGFRMI